jgi:hypothetical protein
VEERRILAMQRQLGSGADSSLRLSENDMMFLPVAVLCSNVLRHQEFTRSRPSAPDWTPEKPDCPNVNTLDGILRILRQDVIRER